MNNLVIKNSLGLIAVVFLLFSCKKENYDIDNLNNNKIEVLGHGGMGIGQSYPMNSLESILNCIHLGADGTEIDVQMTKDGVLVAFHDETLEQSTNLSGRIYNKTWAEVKEARYKNPKYGNYKIIRLKDIFEHIPNQDDYIYILDCKNFQPNKEEAYFQQFNNAIINIIDKYNLRDGTYIEFKHETLIQAMKEIRPDLMQLIYTDFDEALALAIAYNIEGITLGINKLSDERVQLAHDAGVMVATFNTHSHKRNIKAIQHNVDFILTDRVKHLIKILK